MSNLIFRNVVKEDHDNDDDDGDRNSDQEQSELRKDDEELGDKKDEELDDVYDGFVKLSKDEEEFVDEGDKKDEELADVNDFVELSKDDEEFVDEGDKKDEELAHINNGFVELSKDDDEEFVNGGDKKDEELVNISVKETEDEENDGFRTPTSIEHRIPVPTECPPAPKKSCKRKFEGSSIAEIIRSATKAIHDQFMVFKKPRQDDDALS